MSTIFAQTIARAISDYRLFLRKYLSQSERVRKLNELNLKDPSLYEDELSLYHAAWSIVKDIDQNVEIPEQNYYSYSGIAKFSEYLKEYLQNYEVEGNKVIHRAQKASRAMIQAIQVMSLAASETPQSIMDKLQKHNEVIATYGSEEQHQMHLSTLERQKEMNAILYQPVIEHFKDQIEELVKTA